MADPHNTPEEAGPIVAKKEKKVRKGSRIQK